MVRNDINSVSKISALAFSSSIDPIYHFSEDQTNRGDILSQLEAEKSDYANEATDTYDAVMEGIDMFSEDGIIENPDQDLMFLLTDGVPTTEQLCDSSTEATAAGDTLITELAERNIRLYIVLIGEFDKTKVECLTDNEYIYEIADFTSQEFKLIEAEFREILCPSTTGMLLLK